MTTLATLITVETSPYCDYLCIQLVATRELLPRPM